MKIAVMLSTVLVLLLSFSACEDDGDTDYGEGPVNFIQLHDTLDMGQGARNIDVTVTNKTGSTVLVRCYTLPTPGTTVAREREYTFGQSYVSTIPVAFRVRPDEADWEYVNFPAAYSEKTKVVYADNPSARYP